MSSSDRVRLSYIVQDPLALDTVPAVGDFRTARIQSDSLSGNPNVIPDDESGSGERIGSTESIVGLDVGGGLSVKLSPDPFHDDMLEAAMMDTWSAPVTAAVTDIDAATGILTGTGFSGFAVGDMVVVSTSAVSANNVPVYIAAIASATSMTVIAPDGFADEVGVSLTATLPPFVQIGTTKRSFFFAKDFLDLTAKEIAYFGHVLAGFDLTFAFKQHITGNYTLAGTNWEAPTTPYTNGRTVDAIGTEKLLNASQDMGLVIIDGAKADFCIQELKITLDNGLDADECIGRMTPKDQAIGDCVIKAGVTAYLADANFDLVADRIDQVPIEVMYYTRNSNGLGYGFHLPALKLSFPDPANGGKRTKAMLNMEGTAGVGGEMNNAMRIYKF